MKPRMHHRDALLAQLAPYDYHIASAADGLGLTVSTLWQRVRRSGMTAYDLEAARRCEPPLPPPSVAASVPGVATLSAEGVTLSLADYALLRERARWGFEADALADDVVRLERIVAVLTRELERRAVA